ncbi:MAG TPA: hypothetical protein VK579_01235 [Terriglobales bacterium]|nr:hypothetical protein [Terriglobales bacterium]
MVLNKGLFALRLRGNCFLEKLRYVSHSVAKIVKPKPEHAAIQPARRFLPQKARAYGHSDGEHLDSARESEQRLAASGHFVFAERHIEVSMEQLFGFFLAETLHPKTLLRGDPR